MNDRCPGPAIRALRLLCALPPFALRSIQSKFALRTTATLRTLSFRLNPASRPAPARLPRLCLADQFAFERALYAWEELIDATCAAREL